MVQVSALALASTDYQVGNALALVELSMISALALMQLAFLLLVPTTGAQIINRNRFNGSGPAGSAES